MKSRILRTSILAGLALLWALASRADAVETASVPKININQASAAQFSLLPRVGSKQADRIVEYRKAHGQFSQIEEIMEVKGVGEKLFGQLKPYLALSGPTTLASKVSSKGTRGGSSGKKSAAKSASKPSAQTASTGHTR
jgi:competence protein ComEA